MREHAMDGPAHDRPGPRVADERLGEAGSRFAEVEEFIRSELPPPPASVLEVGCGSGELALALCAGGWRVTAVNPQAPKASPSSGQPSRIWTRPITGRSTRRSRCSPCTTPGR